ncbi:MAG: protein arginine kinase [bacterium]|nr:protein arginine kinase [bacterium]
MGIDRYINRIGEWLNGSGENAGIVISSRIRLARNIKGIPFSIFASERDCNEVAKMACFAFSKSSYLANADIIDLRDINDLGRQFLMERHLISIEAAKGQNGLVAIGDKEMISVMVNEEDHLRLQIMGSGLGLLSLWRVISQIDDTLSRNLDYATSLNWGYLTACPTNVGTGMRASVYIHLPALTITNQINKVLKAVSQLGLAIRGIHGEGTESLGNLFQISNQITLGQTEDEIADNIERVTRQIISHEQTAQKNLLEKASKSIEDRIFRAYGILKYSRLISSKETLNLLSQVRLGVNMGYLMIPLSTLNELLIIIQPAHVQKIAGRILGPKARDEKRAEIIRQRLSQ